MSKIEIIREFGELDTIEFSFRYIKLTEKQKTFLEKEFTETNGKFESFPSENNEFVLILNIDKEVNPELIKKLNKQLDIDEVNYGIWVSLISNYDHSGISFPEYIVNFIRIVGGQIDISTILISND